MFGCKFQRQCADLEDLTLEFGLCYCLNVGLDGLWQIRFWSPARQEGLLARGSVRDSVTYDLIRNGGPITNFTCKPNLSGVVPFVLHGPDNQLAGRVHRQVGSGDVALVRGGIEPEAARVTVVQAIETNCVVLYREVVPKR